MKKLFICTACVLLCAAWLAGCAVKEGINRASRVSDTAKALEIKLSPSQLVYEDDALDSQGWGHYYAEYDLSGAPPKLSENEHWRELPVTGELLEFLTGEESRFGRPIEPPARGYWFFRSCCGAQYGGGYTWFGFGENDSRDLYQIAFFDPDTGRLTYFFRARF